MFQEHKQSSFKTFCIFETNPFQTYDPMKFSSWINVRNHSFLLFKKSYVKY